MGHGDHSKRDRFLRMFFSCLGTLEGYSYEDIEARHPVEFAARQRDKLNYRYPGEGELYRDAIERLQLVM